jgi:peptide deformylase
LMEGCLSLPNYYTPLSRSKEVTLKYMNEKGEELTEIFHNFEAQIVQHEVDHLSGIMFVDRLLEQKKTLYKLVNNEWEEVEII